MKSKNSAVIFLTVILLAAFSLCAFAAEYYDEEEYEYETNPQAEANYWSSRNIKPEEKSVDAQKVISSYRLDTDTTRILLDKHKSAGNSAIGKREQAQRYERIFGEYPYDYFAAYRIAEMNYGMTRYSTALKWIDTALKVYPNYVPAKRLKTKIEAALKRTS